MVKERFPSLIRVKCELDKEAIIAMRDDKEFQEVQKQCYIDVEQSESFFVETKMLELQRQRA
jgi:hypothetical protein